MELVQQNPSCKTSSQYGRYDVFLSFRGEDTRKTFTDHLYTALNKVGFVTFRDDDELERGEDIKPGLQQAIKRSRASVIIFSKDYASSGWCLDELVMILESRNRAASAAADQHVVLPVFIDVDPSHVRRQTGILAKAFAKHQKTQPPKKVERWREALAEVADLAGMVLQNEAHGYESKLVEKIVNVIGDKLRRTPLSVAPNMIAMDSRVREINMWIKDGSIDVGVLVMYGISGIGKTTIAKSVYNSNFTRFGASSFLENIKEKSQQPNGIVQIQKQLLYDILNGRKVKIHSVSDGIAKLGYAVSLKKVVLVLDDVDHMNQLDAILRMKDQFYPGSKIIITTKFARLRKSHQVTKEHEVGTLNYNESLELFSWHAFGQAHPVEGYEEYSQKVVHHSGGLPLALQVLGSSLSGESTGVWKSALEKLKVIPNGEIMNKLRISYDSLQDDHDRNLFLHIACFFIEKDEDYICKILDACDFFTIVGIQNLIDRCLVSTDKHGKVKMHDMVRDMGREIVQQESNEPWNRSRLWHYKDSFSVLKEKKGTEKIEGLVLNSNVTILETNAFARMPKLKLLHLTNVHVLDGCYAEVPTSLVQIGGCFAEFPTELRWLCWHEFPLDCIPTHFSLESLVVLEMQYSKLRQICRENKSLPSLKILDLSHSRGLTGETDFSFCPKLEKLILEDCACLIDVHESIGALEKLVYLSMKACKNLRMLPKNLFKLKLLETLTISGCSNIYDFSVEVIKNMESLKVLDIDGVPVSEIWPGRSSSSLMLSSLPCSLVALSLSGCNLSDDAFPTDFSRLSSLRRLNLGNNPICSLPNCIRDLTWLDELSFSECEGLKSLLDLPKVGKLNVSDCKSLEKVTYQSLSCCSPHITVGGNDNLAELEYRFKLVPIGNVEEEIIKVLGLCNMQSMASIRMFNWLNSSVFLDQMQGLYQFGIFNTFFGGNEVPGHFSHKSKTRTVSCTVPSLSNDQKIRGFNMFVVYANSDNNFRCFDRLLIYTTVSNKSKGLKWIYIPLSYGIPGEGEEMTWLSHWNVDNNELHAGDEMIFEVKISLTMKFVKVKEIGIEFVIQQQEENNQRMTTQPNTNVIEDPLHPLWYYRFMPSDWPGFLNGTKYLSRVFGEGDVADEEEGQQSIYHTIPATSGNNNGGLRGWKLLVAVAGIFFSLSLIARSSLSHRKNRPSTSPA